MIVSHTQGQTTVVATPVVVVSSGSRRLLSLTPSDYHDCSRRSAGPGALPLTSP